MAVTETSYTGNGSTTTYSFTFPYLKSTDIEVQLDASVTTNWSLANATQIQFTAPSGGATTTQESGGAPKSNVKIKILRKTNIDNLAATFYAGSAIKSEDLNDNSTQNLYVSQEINDRYFSNTGGTMTGDLTMGEDTSIIFEGATDDDYETTLSVTDPTADRTITLPNVTGTVVTTGDTGSVTSTMIADSTIVSGDIADGTIVAGDIANATITGAKLVNDTITSTQIAADAVGSSEIATDAVGSAEIAANAVGTSEIAADAVTGDQIADNAINSEHYVDDSIDTAHYAPNSVDTAALAADAVTGAQLADDSVDSEHLVADSIDTEHYAANSVDTTALGADCVTGAQIADDSINSEHYVAASIDNEHLADDAVGADELAADAVVNASIAAGAAIAHNKLANVTDGQILVGNGSNVPTAVAVSGDVTIANTGAVTIANDAIEIGMIGCEQTTISDSDSHIPTSGAVVDYVAAQIAPIGGLEVIADKDSFPETIPASGVVISIADADGIVVNGSGVSTTPDSITSNATITINGFPSALQSKTLVDGTGLLVTSTGSSHTYNYHKYLAKEADVHALSDDINNFNERYRVAAGEPSSDNHAGDLVYDTNADKMKVRNAANSAWGEVTSTGDFKYLVLTNPGTTDAATLTNSTFDLKETSTSGSAASVTSAAQLIVSVNGVIQKANTGTSAPAEGFALSDADTIVFSSAPGSGASIFIVQVGSAVSIPTPGDGTVSAAKIATGAVTADKIGTGAVEHAKLANDAVDGDNLADNACDSEHYTDGSIDAVHIASSTITATQIANSTITGGNIAADTIDSEHYAAASIDNEHLADNAVDLAEMAHGTQGDVLYYGSGGAPTRLGAGTSGHFLKTQGGSANPVWAEVSTTDTLPFRNLAINGAMNISQRGNQTGITSGVYGGPDRIKFDYGGVGTWSISQTADAPDNTGLKNCYHLACTTADTSVGAGEMLAIQHIMENSSLHRMECGTAHAKTWAIQFWIKSNKTGTYMAELYRLAQGGTARQISQTFTISSADTWEKKTITFAGDTNAGGVMADDNSAGMQFNIWFAAGTNFTSGTLNTSWNNQTAANRMPGLNVNLGDSTSNYLKFTGLQIEEGSTHTSFEHKSYGDELAACQRYYVMIVNAYNQNICMAMHYGSSAAYGLYHMPVTMRDTPSIDVKNGTNYWNFMRDSSGDNFDTLALSSDTSARVARFATTADISGTSGHAGWFMSWGSGSMSSADIYCALSAEL